MSDPRWPAFLPAPQVNGYSEDVTSPVDSFEPDVGPSIVRSTGTILTKGLRVSFWMRSEQLEVFERFFTDEIGNGTKKFAMAHPRRKSDALFRIDTKRGQPAYQIGAVGYNLFDVKMGLIEVVT